MSQNETIINEFSRLIQYIQQVIDNMDKDNTELLTIYKFKIKNIKNAFQVIKNIPYKITIDNVDDLIKLPSIGKGTIKRIKEILTDGKLSELQNYKGDKNKKLLDKLESIVGVGHSQALKFIKQGVTSIADLKKKLKITNYMSMTN